jgi:hypothetical protein
MTSAQADLESLHAAGEALRVAEERALAAMEEVLAARKAVAAARAARREALAKALKHDDGPERLRACALALGVTTSRVYQLARNYESQR